MSPPPPTRAAGRRWWLWLFCIGIVLAAVVIYMFLPPGYITGSSRGFRDGVQERDQAYGHDEISHNIPQVFFDRGVYSSSDFQNQAGVVPTFWGQNQTCGNDGGCKMVWGPCYPPLEEADWDDVIDEWKTLPENDAHYYSHKATSSHKKPHSSRPKSHDEVDGCCRPGFLIIGQGKCGTSSLYHYLVGHPRVLPASEKQIHYFKYYAAKPLAWYFSHFPTTTSFLGSGALMSGEASPGYLPYPDVTAMVAQRMPGTKIICLGRDPLDRAYSSYRYNYVEPAMQLLRRKHRSSAKGQPDDYFHQFLFSFEDMMRAELEVLRKCLAPGGSGETGAQKSWGRKRWAADVYQRLSDKGLPPPIDLDGHCYGDFVSNKVPRKQWTKLVEAHPEKIINVPNLHLTQAMIGRSLYTYPLEWWYGLFPEEDIYFMCTEEMRDLSGKPLGKVAEFLGLPSFNFSGVVGEGMYNVGGHKGYDKVTTWKKVEEEHVDKGEPSGKAIPLPDDFQRELLDFFKPHNERLFKLVGRRCDWEI